jgi:arylsulfatase A-like enzyme/predicted transcriptional regulator
MRLSALALAGVALALAVACRRQAKAPPAPPLVQVDVTPDFARLRREDPEAEVAEWRRTQGVVLGDQRAAHAVAPGQELLLPLPAGKGFATAFAARRRVGAERDGDAELVLEVQDGGGWRRVVEMKTDMSSLLTGWIEITAELSPPVDGKRARLRASVTNVSSPDQVEFLVEPLRSLEARTDARWNVLVFSVDTLRADHLGCYGYARDTSPRIDALAREGVLFRNVVAAAPWTLPSYGSFFTGCTPAVHRAGVNADKEERFGIDQDSSKKELEVMRPDLPTLAESLSAAGWATAGFQANSFLRAKNGVAKGFGRWVFYQYRSDFGVELATKWIESRKDRPWFCFVHVMDVHQPYGPPPPYDTKFSRRSWTEVDGYPPDIDELRRTPPDDETRQLLVDEYDGAIASIDARIGAFLDKLRDLGELDRTLVVIHSDHGEEFWEHGGYEHGHAQNEEVLHVPLVLRAPKAGAAVEVAARVRGIDVMPTILELVGVEPPKGIEGKSLVPLIQGKTDGPRECVSEATLHGPREIKALTVGDERLVLRGIAPGVLYDLAKDPSEARDLRVERSARGKEMETRLLRRHEILLESAVRAGDDPLHRGGAGSDPRARLRRRGGRALADEGAPPSRSRRADARFGGVPGRPHAPDARLRDRRSVAIEGRDPERRLRVDEGPRVPVRVPGRRHDDRVVELRRGAARPSGLRSVAAVRREPVRGPVRVLHDARRDARGGGGGERRLVAFGPRRVRRDDPGLGGRRDLHVEPAVRALRPRGQARRRRRLGRGTRAAAPAARVLTSSTLVVDSSPVARAQLSEAEWRLMHCLWRKTPLTAREVHGEVEGETGWAYTTVKTMLDRLVEKRALKTSMRGNRALYVPAFAREKARSTALRALVERAFGGTFRGLVEHMVDDEDLSARERADLATLLSKLETRKRT